MESIDVYSVFWGDKYDVKYVYALRDAVKKYLKHPHEFKCITNQKIEGIKTVLPPVSYTGWWQKLGLFSDLVSDKPSLYFDLDVVICGELDYLVPYAQHQLSAPANWGKSGHGGIQSSVLAWNGQWRDPLTKFNWAVDSARLWGDQEFLTELLEDDFVKIPKVKSYKYHCLQTIPQDTSVIAFHGKPDPHEIDAPHLLEYVKCLK